MPAIVVKDYTWRQTEETVIIQVPLAGNPKNIDLFVMGNYMKASYPPFILELFLFANVDEESSKCTVSREEAIFSLQKEEIGAQWPSLEKANLSKEIKRDCRNRALERAQKVAENRVRAKSEKRQLLQKEAVKAQIDLDTVVLNKIEATRDAHRKEAMRDLEEWKSKAEVPILQGVEGVVQENRKAYKPPLKWFKDEQGKVTSEPLGAGKMEENEKSMEKRSLDSEETGLGEGEGRLTVNSDTESPEKASTGNYQTSHDRSPADSSDDDEIALRKGTGVDENRWRELEAEGKKGRNEVVERALRRRPFGLDEIFAEPSRALPLPRKPATIDVTFSQRAFPTPARESSHLEEQEWLQKQAEARRQTGFVAEDLAPEERDPQWLKDKGDEFFKAGNHLAAISAYSHGIKLSEKMASLYVNRSAAHYALGNYFRCTEDCTKALELMEPKCEGNRESRARCHARRGAALCKLSAPQHGIPELEEALKLAPANETIKQDLLAARQYFDFRD